MNIILFNKRGSNQLPLFRFIRKRREQNAGNKRKFRDSVRYYQQDTGQQNVRSCFCRKIECRKVFFDQCINEQLYFVDLPGYGYAKVSPEMVKKWGKMIDNYLENSKVLRLVFLLVDIRHKPNKNDKQMYDWCINYGFNPIIIATKEDKVKRSQKANLIKEIKNALGVIEGTPVIPFSAVSKSGRDDIWEYIDMVYEAFTEEQM